MERSEQLIEAAKRLVTEKRRIKSARELADRAIRDIEAAQREHERAMEALLKVAGVGNNIPMRAIPLEGGDCVVVRFVAAKADGSAQVDVRVVNKDGEVR